MSVAYYPSQAVLVGSDELKLIQSASVDFNISRQEVFEFGTVFAVDSVHFNQCSGKYVTYTQYI